MASRSSLTEMFSGFNSMAPDVWDYREDLQNVAALCMGDGRAAEDGPSELFAALSRFHLPRGAKPVQNWLHVVVTNESRQTAGAGKGRGVDRFLDDAVSGEVGLGTPPPGLIDEIMLRSHILDLVAKLPDRHRAALLLKEGHQLTVGQTAFLLEMSPAAVRSVLYRARQSLRSAIGG